MIVKRRCVNLVSAEASDIFSQEEFSESCRNSWCDLWDESCGSSDCDSVTWTGVLVVTVLVSPSSAVAVMCEGVLFILQKASGCLCRESRRYGS